MQDSLKSRIKRDDDNVIIILQVQFYWDERTCKRLTCEIVLRRSQLFVQSTVSNFPQVILRKSVYYTDVNRVAVLLIQQFSARIKFILCCRNLLGIAEKKTLNDRKYGAIPYSALLLTNMCFLCLILFQQSQVIVHHHFYISEIQSNTCLVFFYYIVFYTEYTIYNCLFIEAEKCLSLVAGTLKFLIICQVTRRSLVVL